MEKQQTAVDFYDQQLHILDLRLKSGSITIGEYFTLKAELFSQSKQMEKEQIEESFNESRKTHPMIGFWWIDFQDYYESKYGKDENKSD